MNFYAFFPCATVEYECDQKIIEKLYRKNPISEGLYERSYSCTCFYCYPMYRIGRNLHAQQPYLNNEMDLEQIFQNAGSMDAQNITLLLLSLMAQFGSSNYKNNKRPLSDVGSNEINQTTDAADDTDVLLALNLSNVLVKYYSKDPALWSAVMANLEKEEIRRKEEANRRLSPITATVLLSFYV